MPWSPDRAGACLVDFLYTPFGVLLVENSGVGKLQVLPAGEIRRDQFALASSERRWSAQRSLVKLKDWCARFRMRR
jgi:hypothetical protein